ncbi:MAG TPA: C39 family peptidase [Vicinamibacteria bacterium]|nr:C39 family peptidase [Vicinamibacteria bacterium]
MALAPAAVLAVLLGSPFLADESDARRVSNESGSEDPRRESAWLLDVPFTSQTEELCGGAAAAMVLRYWGERGIYPEDFAGLVEPGKRGIPTETLTDAIRKRGWSAIAFRGNEELARSQLSRGRPLVVLVEVAPERYHYVVLIGWLPERVVFHDPARAPYRLVRADEFHTAWATTKFWTLLILPPEEQQRSGAREQGESASRDSPPPSCSGMVEEAVRAARSGSMTDAEELLEASLELCPDSSAPLRELAGVRFVQSRWDESAELARQAVALDASDSHAWRTLAASEFLRDDEESALDAWNQLDELKIDLVRVEGLTRTRYEVVVHALDLPPRELLTSEKLGLARRRLSALPVQAGSRVGYRPLTGGLAEVEAYIVERPLAFGGRTGIAAAAMDAAIEREVSLKLSSPSGGGELWSGSWRWWKDRPKLSVALAVPRPWKLPGIWQVEGLWERQSYGRDVPSEAAGIVVREDRRQAKLSISNWRTADSRWDFQTGLDRWNGRGSYAFVGGGLEKRLAADRAALRVGTTGWMGLAKSEAFGVASVSSAWRSSVRDSALVARAGVEFATRSGPLDLWPGAGTGHARPLLLRAHPLLQDGVVRGEAFGRTLVHGGLESQTWFATTRLLRLGVALFADVGKATKPLPNQATSFHVDIGAGFRLKLIGERRALRVDTAWGVRDGEFALSAGWILPWPNW